MFVRIVSTGNVRDNNAGHSIPFCYFSVFFHVVQVLRLKEFMNVVCEASNYVIRPHSLSKLAMLVVNLSVCLHCIHMVITVLNGISLETFLHAL